jgi:Kef-type K+ transport system membrane component KefB
MLVHNLTSPLALALMQIVVILVAARLIGLLVQRIRQPLVIGEMIAGIMLGPSVLGAIWPSANTFLFPKQSLGSLSLLSQLAILLFMFGVGMDLDTALLRSKARSALTISLSSIITPFVLGVLVAPYLYAEYRGANATFIGFVLVMGISLSITAFPVLARIINERQLAGSSLGTTALACAAVDDIAAWCILALIVALSKAEAIASLAVIVVSLSVWAIVLMKVIRPALAIFLGGRDEHEPGLNFGLAVLVTLLVSSLITESIGIHALFGAFLAGIAMPPSPSLRRYLRERLEYFGALLIPVFFAFSGLRTQIGSLSSATDWLIFVSLLGLAIAGKFGASAIAAKSVGMSWRDSAAIGALMNTRGLVELIALNVGLDLGLLSPRLFSMLVLMALVTTFATGPLVSAILGGGVGPKTFGTAASHENAA